MVFVETYRPADEVAEVMRRYDLDAIPVVNVQQRLLGRITIDDVVDLITEQAEEDLQAISGLSGEVEEDDTIWAAGQSAATLAGGGGGGEFAGGYGHQRLPERTEPRLRLWRLSSPSSVLRVAMWVFRPRRSSCKPSPTVQGLSVTLAKRLARTLLVAVINGLVVGLIAGVIHPAHWRTASYFSWWPARCCRWCCWRRSWGLSRRCSSTASASTRRWHRVHLSPPPTI